MTRSITLTLELPEEMWSARQRDGEEDVEVEVEVRFSVLPAELDVGIMSAYTEDHAIYKLCDDGKPRLWSELMHALSESTWDWITEQCNESIYDSYDDDEDGYRYEAA